MNGLLRTYGSLCAACVLLLLAPSARAESDANSRTLAVQLYDEAEALVAQQQFAAACPKYAESYRLDPQLGVLVYLAECYEQNGQLASAWGSFREAEEMARKRGDARANHASERATLLEPRLSYLVVNVPHAAEVPALTVLRDGVPIPRVLWSSRAAVDSGTYRIEARAPGYKPWQKQVVLAGEASSLSIAVPRLEAEPVAPVSTAAPAHADSSSWGNSRRIAALAVGGLGLAGVGAGGFIGLSAQASLSDSKGLCNERNYCTSRGAQLRESAKSKALVATVATSVGAGALATAAVLWFTAPKPETGSQPRAKAAPSAWALAPSAHAWGLELNHAF